MSLAIESRQAQSPAIMLLILSSSADNKQLGSCLSLTSYLMSVESSWQEFRGLQAYFALA